jgi:hypothetical protein
MSTLHLDNLIIPANASHLFLKRRRNSLILFAEDICLRALDLRLNTLREIGEAFAGLFEGQTPIRHPSLLARDCYFLIPIIICF